MPFVHTIDMGFISGVHDSREILLHQMLSVGCDKLVDLGYLLPDGTLPKLRLALHPPHRVDLVSAMCQVSPKVTGEMVQQVLVRLKYIVTHGWAAYYLKCVSISK
jgi:hypothetical protein